MESSGSIENFPTSDDAPLGMIVVEEEEPPSMSMDSSVGEVQSLELLSPPIVASSSLARPHSPQHLVRPTAQEAEVAHTFTATSTYQVGSEIESNFHDKGTWYKGIIAVCNPHGTYSINYNDGDLELNVPMSRIRAVTAPIDAEAEYAKTKLRIPAKRPEKVKLSHMLQKLFHDESYTYNNSKYERVHVNPSIYKIKDFLCKSELSHLDQVVTQYDKKFQYSYTENNEHEKIYDEHRTSKTLALHYSQDRYVQQIEQKAATILGLPFKNVEPIQIVCYKKGQFYNTHHDAGSLLDDGSVVYVPPARLVTIFVYLNTMPEGEGCTEFPALGLSIRPEKCSAVMFCNFLPDGRVDTRVTHAGKPLTDAYAGLRKWGLNIWMTNINMRDFDGAGVESSRHSKILTKKTLPSKCSISLMEEKVQKLLGNYVEDDFNSSASNELKSSKKKKVDQSLVNDADDSSEVTESEVDEEEEGENRNYLMEVPPEKWIGLNVESAQDATIRGKIIQKSSQHTIVTIETPFGDIIRIQSNIMAISTDQDEEKEKISEDWPLLLSIPKSEWIGKLVILSSDDRVRGRITRYSLQGQGAFIRTEKGGVLNINTRFFKIVMDENALESNSENEDDNSGDEKVVKVSPGVVKLVDVPGSWIGKYVASMADRKIKGRVEQVTSTKKSFKFRTPARRLMEGFSEWFIIISEKEFNSGDAIASWTDFSRQINTEDAKGKRKRTIIIQEDDKNSNGKIPTNYNEYCKILQSDWDTKRRGQMALKKEMMGLGDENSDSEDEEEEDEEQVEKFNLALDSKTCRLCSSKKNESKTLICDGCDDQYHMYCLVPKLKKVPEGDWFCEKCKQSKQSKQSKQIISSSNAIKEEKIQIKSEKNVKSGGAKSILKPTPNKQIDNKIEKTVKKNISSSSPNANNAISNSSSNSSSSSSLTRKQNLPSKQSSSSIIQPSTHSSSNNKNSDYLWGGEVNVPPAYGVEVISTSINSNSLRSSSTINSLTANSAMSVDSSQAAEAEDEDEDEEEVPVGYFNSALEAALTKVNVLNSENKAPWERNVINLYSDSDD